MYASASGYHTAGRPRHHRSRTQSDPGHGGHPYVDPPYTIPWPAPARQTTEPMGMTAGMPYQQSPSRSSSIERIPGDPFVPSPGSLLENHMSNSPSATNTSTPVSPRSVSPQRSGHHRSSSKQGSIRAPHGPLIKDVPQPPRTAFNVPSARAAAPHPYLATLGQGPGVPIPSHSPPTPTPPQSAGMQRQGSYHNVYQPGVYQNTSVTHLSHHHSGLHHPNTPHHLAHRSRSRPPSAASHRYASSITQPMHGHGSSGTLNGSRTSLNGGAPSQRNHHPSSPPPGISTSHHPGTGPTHTSPGAPQRSRSRTRVPPSSTPPPTATTHSGHKLQQPTPTPPSPPSPPLAANEIRHTAYRPALPTNYDGEVQTRYVNMLLALDGISPVFNVLASFFTWILLAGFLLFPGTFASWKDEPQGSPQSDILSVINHVSLYIIAFICTGIGTCGMTWLWWRWQNNYIWITNRIFVPGCLNSAAGVISTLSSVYGTQAGVFGVTETSTIIVTGSVTVICGVLVLVYQFWLIRNLKLEHDREVGAEMAGEHGEGILGEKRDHHNREE